MAVFSVNQVRHLYVAKNVGNTTNKGGLVKEEKDGCIYFKYNGEGGIVRSDLIDKKNILSVSYTLANNMAHVRKAFKVTMPANYSPEVGEDYILKMYIRNGLGISPLNEYYKNAVAHAKTTNKKDLFKTLAESCIKNFLREEVQFLNFYLLVGNTSHPVLVEGVTYPIGDLNYDGLQIEEAEQKWELGVAPHKTVDFEVACSTIEVGNSEDPWGEVKSAKDGVTPIGEAIPNGHLIADLEYFCMGDRGDHYRNMGWPNVIKTKYMVDPDQAYNVLDIHYAYVGSNESVQKSEKTLTIVSTADLGDLHNSLVSSQDPSTGE